MAEQRPAAVDGVGAEAGLARRRLLLGAAGAAGLIAAGHGTSSAVAADGRQGPPKRRGPWARKDHTHDAGSLGVRQPVRSIRSEAVYTSRHPRVDVALFGAVGDGVTDDTSAIQAALDSPRDGGGIVAFETSKAYRITGTLRADTAKVRGIEGNNARLVASGELVVLRVQGSHTGSASPRDASSQRVKVPEMNPWVRDLRIHAEPALQATGLQVEGTFGLNIEGCQLFDLGTGVEVRGRNRNLVVANNDIWNCRDYGIWWNGGDIHQVNVVGNHISYCRKVLFFDNAGIYNVQIVGNDLESSTSPDVVEHVVHAVSRGAQIEGFEFIGNSLEDHWAAAGAAVRIDGGSRQRAKQVMIIGNDAGNSRNTDIHISNAQEVVIQGNSIDDSEEYAFRLTGRITDVAVIGNVVRGEDPRPMGFLIVGDDGAATEVSALHVSENLADALLRLPLVVRNATLTSTRISNNTLHYTGSETGYVMDLTDGVRRLEEVHIVGNTLRSSNPGSKAMGVAAGQLGLVIVKDNLGAGFGPDAYDLPAHLPGQVLVSDNLSRYHRG